MEIFKDLGDLLEDPAGFFLGLPTKEPTHRLNQLGPFGVAPMALRIRCV